MCIISYAHREEKTASALFFFISSLIGYAIKVLLSSPVVGSHAATVAFITIHCEITLIIINEW